MTQRLTIAPPTTDLGIGIEWQPKRGGQAFKMLLAVVGARKHVSVNTRAVPLVRKNDAHQGRVSFLPELEAKQREATP